MTRIHWGVSTSLFVSSFVFQAISEKTQTFYKEFEIHFYMKIIVTIILTNLVTNSLLSLFCPFVETKTKNQIFSKIVACNKTYFCFLFLASRALLQRYAKFNKLVQKDFLTCCSCSYGSSIIILLLIHR